MPGKAYRSKLRPFLTLIKEGREAEKTWVSIADEITSLGVPTDFKQVQKFFARSLNGKLPLGFVSAKQAPSQTPVTGEGTTLPPSKTVDGLDDLADEPPKLPKIIVS